MNSLGKHLRHNQDSHPDHYTYYFEMFPDQLRDIVFSRAVLNQRTGCIEWQGCTDNRNYGYMTIANKLWIVPRIVYMLCRNDFQEHLFICHHCDNPLCINPDHLYAGTPADNGKDKAERNRSFHPVGKLNPNFGKPRSEEVRGKISLSRKGKNTGKDNPMYGRSISREERRAYSLRMKGRFPGENNPNCKLSDKDVKIVRYAFSVICSMGVRKTKAFNILAEHFNVSRSLINLLIRNASYRVNI